MAVYCVDIDGTLCSNTEGDYASARPFAEAIGRVNTLYDEGHTIVLFTARGSTTKIDWSELTKRQLAEWNLKYHELIFGKPYADYYIDDKAINVRDFMTGR
jgi:uncharacterized HAD superfamily protein